MRGSTDPYSALTPTHSQSSNNHWYEASSYQPPSINQVLGDDLPNGNFDDSTMVQFVGSNFGIDGGEISVTYAHGNDGNGNGDGESDDNGNAGDPTATKYVMGGCVVVAPHTLVNCSSVPGVGAALRFRLKVAGLSAQIFNTTLKYNPPFIAPPLGSSGEVLNAVYGPGAHGANTRGGEEMFLFGRNFGPANDPFLPRVTYGGEMGREYEASNCVVESAFNKVRCLSAPGTGVGHRAVVRIGGQESQLYAGNVSYGQPSVHYFEPEWKEGVGGNVREGGRTGGGGRVLIHGDNFGEKRLNRIDGVSYGVNGNEFKPCVRGGDSDSCDCKVVTDHTLILCNTTEGTGKVSERNTASEP